MKKIVTFLNRSTTTRMAFALVLLLSFACRVNCQSQKSMLLWYDKPAVDWMTEALPIGNGFMGAMFFGGHNKEQIQFTEGSLWSGGPNADTEYNFGIREGSWKYLPEVRALLAKGKIQEAHALAGKELSGIIHKSENSPMFGDYGAQVTMGDLYIELENGESQVMDYQRSLDISQSIGKVSYVKDGKQFKRTYFASYPDNVLVYKLESDLPSSYQIEYVSPHEKIDETFSEEVYIYNGKLKYNDQKYETRIKVESDGIVQFSNGKIKVEQAKYVILYHTSATEYLPNYPSYSGNDFKSANAAIIEKLGALTYEKILQRHISDYRELFDRVKLDLGSSATKALTTDGRLKAYSNGAEDLGFEQLYFQYGRYLMISSSRPGSLPMNLQGKWNNSIDPPWASDYHMNINQQMLYWPAEVTNLPECHLPLFDYMQTLVEPGRRTAQEHFNMNGWVVNTMNNAYGYTAPGWGFPWGYFPGGAAWLCQHLWEHYEFTQNKTFLSDVAYPMMKEAALFWLDYLTTDENGQLVSVPSYSPEHGGISSGASMDHQMAWDLLNNCTKACEVLGVDGAFQQKAAEARDKILAPKVGKWGQLQEWKEDVDDPESKHRHVSHLFALHPGNQITVERTSDLAEAAKVSLNARGDDGTGWSLAWKVNFWARLKEGDRAYKLYRRLLRSTENQGTDMVSGGGTYPNLLCAHPPFQLDGNMGGSAGLAELLLQSHTGEIELLPALPSKWANGKVSGLKARGGYEIDLSWQNGLLQQVTLMGKPGNAIRVKYAGKSKSTVLDNQGRSTLEVIDFN